MMTLEQVRDALKGVWVPTHWGTDGRSYKMSDLIESLDHYLSQPKPVAQGDFSVQVTAERMDEVITSMHGPDGEACAGTLWVGRLDDCGPDGSSRYGIHISCNECPEAGSVTLAEFDAPKVVAKGEAVAEVVNLRSDNYGHHHRIKWLDHYNTAYPVGTRLYATPTIPTGHRVVPVEPTEAMVKAGEGAGYWGYHESSQATRKDDEGSTTDIYQAMLAAAPDAGVV